MAFFYIFKSIIYLIPRRAFKRSSTGGWVINIFVNQETFFPLSSLKGEEKYK